MLTLVKQNDIVLVFTWQQLNGTACDVTGTKMIFTMKTNMTDADPGVLQKTWNPATYTDSAGNTFDTTQGQTTLSLSPTDTDLTAGTYYWDVKAESGGKVFSTQAGIIQVIQNITVTT